MSGQETGKDQRSAQDSTGLFCDASEVTPLNLHASCVAFEGTRALLILGPSGSGKSTLALELMAYGATLVSDDRTILTKSEEGLIATAPAPIRGMIEARGMGLLAAQTIPAARICGLADLSQVEMERLPPRRERVLIGVPIPLFFKVEGRHFAPALVQWLKGGRCA
ncbi:MAG: HPr kinase/phosphatase C-terminal domain-containing protein [Alphaproteobacteria bacterium]|nr:HPr kinase/phosphatase C-terminal domain-containing protein [Alphaproteobacteria bacterium]MBU1279391.1 HPr kinase/phosphatase C-terminal domain-containing protein [Alphaproteobacteria bacterium]MBU1572446.1 HPr kinase/phosphatase C-terminal domain-containing protein [Alphaproteobacteria bacterium]MBU1829740.1 HPr kinase/phosphatase C-terminal domain-containing protein [Alphaproteobacteria bacterium]MBU2077729.1 HPr kinase/phosphatase C-terminal domain-containing protein [Alphaproteobacteria